MTDERKNEEGSAPDKGPGGGTGAEKEISQTTLYKILAKAINTYDLLQEGDKVAVCISGGKDSMLMAKLFQELKKAQ